MQLNYLGYLVLLGASQHGSMVEGKQKYKTVQVGIDTHGWMSHQTPMALSQCTAWTGGFSQGGFTTHHVQEAQAILKEERGLSGPGILDLLRSQRQITEYTYWWHGGDVIGAFHKCPQGTWWCTLTAKFNPSKGWTVTMSYHPSNSNTTATTTASPDQPQREQGLGCDINMVHKGNSVLFHHKFTGNQPRAFAFNQLAWGINWVQYKRTHSLMGGTMYFPLSQFDKVPLYITNRHIPDGILKVVTKD